MDYNQDQKRDRKTLLWAALAVLALLNMVLLYFIFQERQQNQQKDSVIEAKTEELLTARSKLDSISYELEAKIAEIQQLGGSVDSLIALKTRLENDKIALKNVSNFSATKYNEKIKSYETILNQKDQEILRLREELGIVTAKNEALQETVTNLESKTAELADSVTNYAVKNKEFAALNQELSEKVTLASALRAEKITVNSVSAKGKESDGGRYRARRIDKLKVSFTLGENAVAKQNRKEILMRVLDPQGAVLSDMATGSGAFVYNGREMIYSAKEAVNFTNSREQVAIYFGRNGMPLKDGKYVIELYCEGFKIGQGDFTVR